MPWVIRLLPEKPPFPQVGDAWFEPGWREMECLSEHYKQNVKDHRPPFVVCLPDTQLPYTRFCVDMATDDNQDWSVSGDPPLISIPSINCVGSYHGCIQQGIIADDRNGRKYPHAGKVNWQG